jgi:hypothetical protein
MAVNQEDLESLELMARNEEQVSRLYHLYAQKLPEKKEFWEQIAVEEDGHAEIIRGIIPYIQDGTALLKEERFKKEAILAFLGHLEEANRKATERSVALINAYSTALNIEKSLIEKDFFKILKVMTTASKN